MGWGGHTARRQSAPRASSAEASAVCVRVGATGSTSSAPDSMSDSGAASPGARSRSLKSPKKRATGGCPARPRATLDCRALPWWIPGAGSPFSWSGRGLGKNFQT